MSAPPHSASGEGAASASASATASASGSGSGSSSTPAAGPSSSRPSATTDAHECSVCHKTFSRQEHLRRHFLTHEQTKSHVCDVCHRAYSRPDVLLRHKATHHPSPDADADGEGGSRRHEPEGDRFRACRECAQARVRCSGREPCARCARTGKACRYPEARRRGERSSSPRGPGGGPGEWRAEAGYGDAGGYGQGNGHGQTQGHGQGQYPPSAFSTRPPSPAAGYMQQGQHGQAQHGISSMNTRPPSPTYAHQQQPPSIMNTRPPSQSPAPAPGQASSIPAYGAHPTAPMHPPSTSLAFPTDPSTMYPMAAPPAPLPSSDPLGMMASMPPLPEYAAADMSNLSSTVARTSALPHNWLGDIGTMWDDLMQYQDLFSFAPDTGFGTGGINWLAPQGATAMPGLNQWDGVGMGGLSQAQPVGPQGQAHGQGQNQHQQGMAAPQPMQTIAPPPGPGQTLPAHLPSIMNMSAATTPVATPNGGAGVSVDHASTGVSSTRSKYYVGGDGGRAPQLKRPIRKRAMKAQIFMASRSQRVPDVTTYHPDISPDWVTQETYHGIRRELLLARGEDPSGAASGILPSLADFNLFVQSYVDEFHTNNPLFRRIDIKEQRYTPLELLAISAIGAGHIGVNPAKDISLDLHRAIHRALDPAAMQHPTNMHRSSRPHELGQMRAHLLNVMGMFHSGDRELVGFAFTGRAALVASCLQLKLLEPVIRPMLDEHSAQAKQRNFLDQQARSRIGYGIWLLDCMIAYQTDMRPLLTLQDANAPMPCSDTLWEDVESKWPVIANGQRIPASLREALETLYTEKRIMYNCTDVGRTIMIHGIFQRTWEVEKVNQDALSTWKPSRLTHNGVAERKSASAAQATIAEWRNSACDCLDVLHFAANIRVASATGLEHPLILHLHLSRIILVTPLRRMQELVMAHTPETRLDSYEEIIKWALQDPYKARLAVLHAASVFWHVRRYSCDVVVEPYCIYVATLVLWIYSISRIVSKQTGYELSQEQTENKDDFEALEFTNLNIDRPCDDESGMAWIRSGDQIEAHIFRVGPICQPGAPDKILKEGARLLSKQDGNTGSEAAYVWGCSDTYMKDLNWFRACLAQHRVGD